MPIQGYNSLFEMCPSMCPTLIHRRHIAANGIKDSNKKQAETWMISACFLPAWRAFNARAAGSIPAPVIPVPRTRNVPAID